MAISKEKLEELIKQEKDGFEVMGDVGLVEIQSLEQHEAEIKKPLEDIVERLIQEIKDLECLVKLKEQSKQEVIAELEEWVDNNKYIFYQYAQDRGTVDVNAVNREQLKQKLNEMKEV